jgi:hypothetical protein
MNDRAPMQHGDVIFSLTDKPQENVGEPLSLRYVEAAVPNTQFRACRSERKAESYHLARL